VLEVGVTASAELFMEINRDGQSLFWLLTYMKDAARKSLTNTRAGFGMRLVRPYLEKYT
jgi:hypothetical protein